MSRLTKRIENLEEVSLAGKVIHRPQTAEELLELMRTETRPVFAVGDKIHTVESFLQEIYRRGTPLVREDSQ